MRRSLLAVLVLLFFTGASFGAGFGLYEFGARASSLGGAVVAQAYDASTAFYNPAGLAFQKGTQFYGGVTLISAANRWVGAAPIFSTDVFDSKDKIHTPIGVYLTHSFSENFAAGISVTNPFGLGLEWPDDFPGRVVSRNVDLKSFYISPVIAFKIHPNLSIGGGPDLVYSTVSLERNALLSLDPPYTDPGQEIGKVMLDGNSGLGIGFSASMMYRYEKFSLGFLYRHKVKNEFKEGDAKITLFDTPFKTFIANQGVFVDQKANTEITYPSFISVGTHYQVNEKLGVEFDFMWYKWDVFDILALDFEHDELDTEVKEGYNNSSQFRVGLHYQLSEALEARAGYIYDQTPQPKESMSPLLPDNNRNDYSFGLGYKIGKMRFGIGYMFVDFGERSTVENGEGKQYDGFNGTYASKAHLFFFNYGVTL